MKLMNGLKIGFFVMIVFMIASCGSKHKGYTKHKSGIYSKFHVKTDGRISGPGDIITLDVRYGTKDSVIFDSKIAQTPFKKELTESEFTGDIYECINMMALGDSASFIIRADSFYLITARTPEVPKLFENENDFYIDLYLKEIMSREEAKEQVQNELDQFKKDDLLNIKTYLKSKGARFDNEGIYFEEIKKGSRVNPKEGQMVMIHYDLSLLDGTLIYSSRTNKKTVDFEFNSQFETDGFKIGLARMSKGGVAEFMVPSHLAFAEKGNPQARIKPYSALVYNVEIVDIVDKQVYEDKKKNEFAAREGEEIKQIAKYLEDNKLPKEPTTESGLYYIEISKGEGPKVKSGDKIKVHYTLYLLDGKMVDSSVEKGVPYELIIDQTSVIKGWHEGLKLMNVGSKAKILIPSSMGYGDRKRSEDILPYTPLLFKLEVLEIIEK